MTAFLYKTLIQTAIQPTIQTFLPQRAQLGSGDSIHKTIVGMAPAGHNVTKQPQKHTNTKQANKEEIKKQEVTNEVMDQAAQIERDRERKRDRQTDRERQREKERMHA